MRPIIRRDERDGLGAARRLVSGAERSALDRAEQLRREAEDLLQAVTGAGGAGPAGDLGAKTAAHAEELGRLRADQHRMQVRLDRIESRLDAADTRPVAKAPAPPPAADHPQWGDLIAAAQAAEEQLAAAMVAIEQETRRAAAIRAEAEAIGHAAAGEAQRIVDAARAEAESIRRSARDEGRADGRATLEEARRRFAEETAGLRVAMDQTWSTLEKLIGSPDRPG